MEINQIRYFLALAETLNFTKAAELCDVSQPTLSRGVKSLELEFGAELVRRERGLTHLTELGRIVRPSLERALALTESVKADAVDYSTMAAATLKLGIMCTIGPVRLIPIITHLTTKAPQINIELLEAPGEQIVEMLSKGEIDVALVGVPHYPDTFALTSLYEERYVVAFPPGHRFENMDGVPVSQLHGEPYLERLNCEYVSQYVAQWGAFEFEPDVRYRSEHEDWIQAMIVAGMGCACMPEFMALFPELMRKPLIEPEVKRTISAATVRGRKHSPVVGLFVSLCMEFHRQQY